MSAEEFIETYGRIEMMKMQKAEELGLTGGGSKLSESMSGKSLKGVGKMDGKPAMGMADMKEMMKNQLMNVKLYGEKDEKGAFDGRKSSKQLTSLNSLEGEFDMPKFGKDSSTTSFKATRNSVATPGAGGALRPPTSLKTPTAASYSSLTGGFKPNKK